MAITNKEIVVHSLVIHSFVTIFAGKSAVNLIVLVILAMASIIKL